VKTGLAALVHPKSISDFMQAYEANEPFVIHHNDENVKPLMTLPALESLDVLLRSWPYKIQVHLPDVRDEASSVDTTPSDARKLFDNGMGLLFNESHRISPMLQEWLEEIRKDLRLSAMTYGRCLFYATPKGKGTAPHFDQNINFVLQVHGEKTWYMAPNKQLKNPLTRHTMSLEPDPEMQGYLRRPFPKEMPADAQKIVLKPGSLLFVPRGYWHSTDAQEDALSLNFTFTAATWIDLFQAALRSRLSLSEEWRATADGVSSAQTRAQAERNFNAVLAELVRDLPNWQAEDILNATDGDPE
jgi:Uncharacterized conserved protein